MIVGADGAPLFLSNGVQEATKSDRSWTLVQPVAQQPGEAGAPKPSGAAAPTSDEEAGARKPGGAEAPASCSFAPTRLRVNGLVEPLGLQAEPHFSWGLAATTTPPIRNQAVSARRIECFDAFNASRVLWDSGRVAGAETLHV
eukprot:2882214-Prymnesium_polylepis.1